LKISKNLGRSLFCCAVLSLFAVGPASATALDPFLVWADHNLSTSSGTINGDVYAGGNIAGNDHINGNATATGTIAATMVVSGTKTAGAPLLTLPTLTQIENALTTLNITFTNLTGNQTFAGTQTGVFVVNGNVTINSTYSGAGLTIITTGGGSITTQANAHVTGVVGTDATFFPFGLLFYTPTANIGINGTFAGSIVSGNDLTLDTGSIVNTGQLGGGQQTETPLPAALPMFVSGLGGLGLLGWRRKRKQRN